MGASVKMSRELICVRRIESAALGLQQLWSILLHKWAYERVVKRWTEAVPQVCPEAPGVPVDSICLFVQLGRKPGLAQSLRRLVLASSCCRLDLNGLWCSGAV